MLLKEWVKKNDINTQDLADQVGLCRARMSQLINGIYTISVENAKKIERISGGAVSRLEMLYPEEYMKKQNNEKKT